MSELTSVPVPSGDGNKTATPPQQNTLGVTVKNVPDAKAQQNDWERMEWYVLRTPYFRADRVKQWLDDNNFEAYLPKRKTVKLVNGHRRRVEEICIPNTVFVFANRLQTEQIIHNTPGLSAISYVYNHCISLGDGKNPPLIIPQQQMENFRKLVSIDNEHIVDITNNVIKYKQNDRVRITEGQFKGIEGRVAKIFGQTRVVVELSGLCLMATAYVPKAFLKPID